MSTYFTLSSYALFVYATAIFAQKWGGSKTMEEQEHKLGYSTLLYLALEYVSYLIIANLTLLFSNHGSLVLHATSINYYVLAAFSLVYFLVSMFITALFGALVDFFVINHYQKKRLNTKIDIDKAKQDLQGKL